MSSVTNISRGCAFIRNSQNKTQAKSIDGGHKMEVFDWLENMPRINPSAPKLVEVRFKNTRKSYFVNSENLPLKRGDIVAVEGNPGTDIGIVTIMSDLVVKQIKRTCFRTENDQYKKVLRLANNYDVERWSEAISKEHHTMIESRQISVDLGLDMKIGDVEYQGDGMKAIFYYIADGRVDFRELIKVLFDRFRVRIEMKQIGARQEAGRIGGIGPCGRELCCSSWMNTFTTIGIGAARTQDISLNPQKLAGQCGKLKCCLNYEVDSYIDAKKSMPRLNAPLEAMDGKYFLVKSDPLAKTMYFSPAQHDASIFIPLSADRVREILAINAKGEKVSQLQDESQQLKAAVAAEIGLQNVELEDSLTRFDKKANKQNKQSNSQKNNRGRNNRNRRDNQNGQPSQNNGSKSSDVPRAEGEKSAQPQKQRNERGAERVRQQQDTERGDRPRNNNRRGDDTQKGNNPQRQENQQRNRNNNNGNNGNNRNNNSNNNNNSKQENSQKLPRVEARIENKEDQNRGNSNPSEDAPRTNSNRNRNRRRPRPKAANPNGNKAE